jgi:NADPH:quinone reductase-like Zn-dependent oxidoreductase
LCPAWCWHEIDTVGKDVSRFTEGDQVFGFDRFAFGCYAGCKCTAETGVLTAKPSNLSYEQAAAIPYGRLTHKGALIRYKDWIWRSTEQDSPRGGGGEPVPAAPVRAPAEWFLADAILVSGGLPPARSAVSDLVFGDVAAALREHGSATLDERCYYVRRPD